MVLLSTGERVLDILEYAIAFFNKCWALIIDLITLNPTQFAGSREGGTAVFSLIEQGYNIVLPVGAALTAVFFLFGWIKTTTDVMVSHRTESIFASLLRMAAAAYFIIHGMQLLTQLMLFGAQLTNKLVTTIGLRKLNNIAMPNYIRSTLVGLKLTKTPLQAILSLLISFLGMVLIIVAMVSILLTLYGRFFRLYMYVVLAPIPISTIAGTPTQHIGINFFKSFIAVCLECASVAVALIVYVSVANYLLPEIELKAENEQAQQRYNELVQKSQLSEERWDRILNGEGTAEDLKDLWGNTGKAHNEGEGWIDDALYEAFYEQNADNAAMGAVGYHKALLNWLVSPLFSLFLLMTIIKSVDQITAKIMGIGG